MPAYELREHREDHGYNVLGRYVSADEAKSAEHALVAEDRQRLGRYTINYVSQEEPDMLRRTKAPPELPRDSAADVVARAAEDVGAEGSGGAPASTAADAVDNAAGKTPTVSAAARAAGAKKP